MNKIKVLLEKYREQVLYLLFGAFTSVISLGSYWLLDDVAGQSAALAYAVSWLAAVLFAFITNKLFVFGSRKSSAKKSAFEAVTFVGGRILTGIVGGLFTVGTVDKLGLNGLIMRFIASCIEVVLNYLISKLIVFRKKS